MRSFLIYIINLSKVLGCSREKFALQMKNPATICRILVERDGFEPSKSVTTDLQSAPFGHSGTSPYLV